MKNRDLKSSKRYFNITIFVITLIVFAIITTIQMKIIGNYIDINKIPLYNVISIFGFWFISSVSFTLLTSWQIRKKYQEPLERLSCAATKVSSGDFSVYLRPEHTSDKADWLDELIDNFNKMVEELGSIETLKTDFFSDVSHEFKTPLTVIYSNAEMLKNDRALTEEQQEYIDNILYSTKRLSNLIQNMLKLNKLEKQTILPVASDYDVCAQLCECAVQYEDAWEQKNIDFEASLDDYAMVHADSELMELVWSNLFSNAVKFTPDGGTITLSETTDDNNVIISISDTGCGMDEQAIKHIFDKFYQGDSSHSTHGNGLGLALVKRILELSDATITVKSVPQSGSTFTVTIPKLQENKEM